MLDNQRIKGLTMGNFAYCKILKVLIINGLAPTLRAW